MKNFYSSDVNLLFCKICLQMTNHFEGGCLKCAGKSGVKQLEDLVLLSIQKERLIKRIVTEEKELLKEMSHNKDIQLGVKMFADAVIGIIK